MNKNKRIKKVLLSLLAISIGTVSIASCSKKENGEIKDMITVNLGSDPSTIDPQKAEDLQSQRVVNDLFEGLTVANQENDIVPGLAEKWDISEDGKVYTFYLRDNLKFSDGTPITAYDVIFSYQRLVDHKTASPYSNIAENIVNAKDITRGMMSPDKLGVIALNDRTIQIKLEYPDPSFLNITSLWCFDVVSKNNILKYGDNWIEARNIVTSGAYKLDDRVIKGHILESKNPNYYDAAKVKVNKIKFLPIEDVNSAFNQYKTGEVDITSSVPVDQYNKIKETMGSQLHTVLYEGIYYYMFNMSLDKYKNNPQLRQALSMAIDRNTLTKDILKQGEKPLYSLVTSTIEADKFGGLDYEWSIPTQADKKNKIQGISNANLQSNEKRMTKARELFKQSGYSDSSPLTITINYNTDEVNKRVALAVASMWKQAFGEKSIIIKTSNKEYKTFLQSMHDGDYDITRRAWIVDYDDVDNYTGLYECNNTHNYGRYCNEKYDSLIKQARDTKDAGQRVQIIRQAIQIAQDDYAVIPLYQYTYSHLISPDISGYTPENNHLNNVYSKWYKFN
ncbi:MAG: peptide ABC transporter substrate-binding protein [Burkholderiales bacterium]|nr:peptide ABC transporter substrate-binding protein [Burkholderiales bacterium]